MLQRIFWTGLAGLTLFVLACHRDTRSNTPTLETYQTLPRILIMPVRAYDVDPKNGHTVCPICQREQNGRGVSRTEIDKFSTALRGEVERSYRFRVLSPDLSNRLQPPLAAWNDSPETWQRFWHEAQDLGADYVIFATLFRFEERQGKKYAAAHPASVAFDLHLFQVPSGRTVAVGAFDETQTSLSENVLTVRKVLRRRARWLTASELAQDGLSDVLAGFPPLG